MNHNRVHPIDVSRPLCFVWELKALDITQETIVRMGDATFFRKDVFNLRKLRDTYRSLIASHAEVESSFFVTKAWFGKRKIAKQTHTFGELLIVCCDHAAFAGSDHFICIEAEASHVAEAACHSPATSCAVRLRAIFDDQQVVPSRNLHQPVHVDGMAVEMHGDNGFCSVCY